MRTAVLPPTADLVREACTTFDRDYQLTEQTLTELFQQFPGNSDLRHVLLKVLAVNTLYHTSIFAVETVARHIHANHEKIDAAIAAGAPEIVDEISRITVNGKVYNFFSFASKYCSWHNSGAYPIYDSHVDHYLWALQKQNHFTSFLHPELWNYPKFLAIMTKFRSFHGLDAVPFKEIDKFLYLQGAPHAAAPAEEQPRGPGAFDFYSELTT